MTAPTPHRVEATITTAEIGVPVRVRFRVPSGRSSAQGRRRTRGATEAAHLRALGVLLSARHDAAPTAEPSTRDAVSSEGRCRGSQRGDARRRRAPARRRASRGHGERRRGGRG